MIIKFKTESDADRWQWLFGGIFRMYRCCCDGYYNAFSWH